MIKRPAFLAALLLGLAACGGEAGSTTGSASPPASTAAKPSSTPKPEASTPPKPAEPSNEALAFKMGNKYGFAVNFAILKKQDLVDKNVALVKDLAGKLGVAAPELPTGGKKMPDIVKATEAELKKKSPSIADAFVLGQELADQFMGANLDATDKATIADIAVRGKGAGLKSEDVTKKHAALGAKPTPDQVTELANACAKEFGIALN